MVKEQKTWQVMLKATAHEPIIYNTKTKAEMDVLSMLCWIANKLEEED